MGSIKQLVDASIQDQNSPPIRYYLMNEEKSDITLTSPVAINDTVINVSASHGITVGKWLSIFYLNFYIQVQVTNVATNAITIDRPLAYTFPVSGTMIVRGIIDMNIDASTPFVFQCLLRTFTQPIHINKVLVIINSSADGDDSKFGGITALTNGVYLRKETNIGYYQSLGLFKNNADFREYGGIIEYSSKAPSGSYGVNVTFQMNHQTGFGVVYMIENIKGDSIKLTLRDNLSTLTRFRTVLIGHYTV
jgi:hypothetical protein